MGPAGLTAVFGMGTGVTPPVWSPEMRPAGGQARRRVGPAVVGHARTSIHRTRAVASGHDPYDRCPDRSSRRVAWLTAPGSVPPPGWRRGRSGWSSARLLVPVG